MSDIFGVSTTTIMFVLLGAFIICLSVATWIVLRHLIVFKLGVRNIPRRPSQTILIVVGLMLSTLIIAAAFTTGDTLNLSIRGDALKQLGQTDQRILPDTGAEDPGSPTGAVMSQSIVVLLERRLADDPVIDGLMPFLSESVPVANARTQLSEPALQLTGLDVARLEPFGGVKSVDGKAIDMAALPDDGVVLSEMAAEKLGAWVGDSLFVYVSGRSYGVTVEAIAEDSIMTGYNFSGAPGGLAMPLDRAQHLLAYGDRVSSIEVTNRGGVRDGVRHTDSAMVALDAALADTPYRAIPVKRNAIETAELVGNVFLTVFLIFGLFSISVGVLLIFLIFVMLAAERKSEMGMARAVGLKRRQLTQMFLAEGIAYDLVSAFIGAALGVGVAFVMAGFLSRMFSGVLVITPTATWTGLIIAYTLGVTVTFVTILISSWRVSNLNIVQSIRDLPESAMSRAGRRWLIFGMLGLILGGLMTWAGGASGSAFSFMLGLSLIPLSLAALLRRFGAPARLLYSVAAVLVLVLWLLPESVSQRIFPELNGSIEMFFLSGMMLVAAATVLIVWNAPVVTGFVGLLGHAFSRWLPAVKTAVAYPLERKGRTGMTIAMFSLVIFALVMMATMSASINKLIYGSDVAAGRWDIQAVQAPSSAVDDLASMLARSGVNTEDIVGAGRLVTILELRSQVRMAGEDTWQTYQVNGANDAFIDLSDLPLQTRAVGYESDRAVWDAVRDNPNLAVIDNNALETGGDIAFNDDRFVLEGVKHTDETMAPIDIEVGDPVSGEVRTVTIIGVLDTKVVAFFGVVMSERSFNRAFSPASISYVTHVMRLEPGVDGEAFAKTVESSLVAYGVQAMTYDELIESYTAMSRGFLILIEAFMLLGLVVGVAALGVIAFRSVVERRQQIGMLRAIGYKRSMVSASFLIESSMVTILGIISGTLLALALTWNLVKSDYFVGTADSVDLVIPYGEIGIFLLIALAASLLMAWIPARRAARVPIATALRYE